MLRVQEPIDKCRPGDIICWTNVAHGCKNWRVVENWCNRGEPRQLLVTEVDGTDGKCFIALAADCSVVEERGEVTRNYRKSRETARELPKHQLPREEPV